MPSGADVSEPRKTRPMPWLMTVYAILTTVLASLSWSISILLWVQGRGEVAGMWAHWNDRFADIEHYDGIFRYFHQPQFFLSDERFAYPAPSAVVYDLLLQLQRFHLEYLRLGVVITVCLALALVPAYFLCKELVRRGVRPWNVALFVASLLVTSWPFVFLIERANLEFVVVLLTFAGAASYWRGKPVAAGVFWALAGSMKIYPIVMLLLFVRRDERKALLAGIGTFFGSVLLSSWFVGPTLVQVMRGTIRGMSGFLSSYADRIRFEELKFDHSYLAVLKTPLSESALMPSLDVTRLTHLYLAVVVPVALLVYVFRVRSLPPLNRYMLLSLAMVTLPPVSYDYTLVHLYPCLGLLVLLSVQVRDLRQRCLALIPLFFCFALVFAPENFAFYGDTYYSGPIKATAMLLASLVLLWSPLPALRLRYDADGATQNEAEVAA